VFAQVHDLPRPHTLDEIRNRVDDDLAPHAMGTNDAPGDHMLLGLPGAFFRFRLGD
jgi:hypothetical protein